MFSNFSFLKNKVYKPINNKKPAPAKAMLDLWLSTRLNKEVKKLQIKSKIISLLETPATKAYPERFPFVRLCLIMAKMTGPIEMLKIKPNSKPFKIASITIKIDFV
jgi:hypothetical protein